MLCRDAQQGQDVVKSKRELYLPPTAGMLLDGMREGQDGLQRYYAYLKRAVFPEVFTDTVNTLVGIMNKKPPRIELPAAMEPMMEKATILGESLYDLIHKVHEQQMVTGRVGLHLDVPEGEVRSPNMLPLISTFNAETITNWDDGGVGDPTKQTLNLVVLNASEWEREGFTWNYQEKYRVLVLGDFEDNEQAGLYSHGIFRGDSGFDQSELVTPLLRGAALNEIPFVFIGPKDINIDPDIPPLLGLADRSMAIYMGEADHRQSLHVTAEETLVTIGQPMQESDSLRVGTGARIAMVEGGDVKYVGPESRALQYQANKIQIDYDEAKALSSRLTQGSSQVESGEALRIRVAAQTSNLTTIATAGAGGLQEILRIAARWLNLNPEEVIVHPNLDFADDPLEFKEVNDMLTFKQRGGVMSHQTINDIMRERELTKRTLEEEIEAIQAEEGMIPQDIADIFAMGAMNAAGGPLDDEEDDEEDEDEDDDEDPNINNDD